METLAGLKLTMNICTLDKSQEAVPRERPQRRRQTNRITQSLFKKFPSKQFHKPVAIPDAFAPVASHIIMMSYVTDVTIAMLGGCGPIAAV
jgi:hypothetical protein